MRRLRAWMLVVPVDAVMLLLPVLWWPANWRALLVSAALTVVLLHGAAYRARLHLSVLDELPWLVVRYSAAVAVVATITALRRDQPAVAAFLVAALAAFGFLVVGRILTTQIVLRARRKGMVSHRTVIVGGGPVAGEIALVLSGNRRYGLSVVGYVDDAPSESMPASVPQLGTVSDLDRVAVDQRATAVLVAEGAFADDEVLDILRRPLSRSSELLVVPRLHNLNTQVGLPDHVGSIPVMRISRPALAGPAWTTKRVFDVVVASALLLATLPVLLLCALAVRFEGGPGVIFRQKRVGRDGITFDCLKFRSLRPSDEKESDRTWTVVGDTRIGPIGRFLRRSSLDELPQLWNVLRGDMTLVGPRPERPHFVERFSTEIPRYSHRHRVRAGLTGLAQVSGLRGDTSITDRARFDNYYIENWSLWMDAKVMLRTVGEVLFGSGR